MKPTFSHLIKHIAVYGIGDLILKATAFITMPMYTRIFTPKEYGIWNLIATIVGLLSILLSLGGETTYARFFFDAKTWSERQLVTSTWFVFLSLWSLIIVGVCILISSYFSQWAFGTDQYAILFLLSLVAAPVSLINNMCSQVLRNQFRPKLFSALNVISTTLSIGLSLYGAIVLDLGLVGVLGGALAAVCIMLPLRLWTVHSILRPLFSLRLLKKLLMFALPLVPMSLAYWIFGMSDRIILGKLSTLDQVGLYGIAFSLTSILSLVNVSLGQAWGPIALQLYEEERNAAPAFFGQAMTYILVGFGVFCVGIATFAKELLIILSTPAYYPAAIAVGPLSLGLMACASTQVTALGISFTMKTKYFAVYSWLAALLNLILNILFIPRWGMIAAGWATAISYMFISVSYLITTQRLWPVAYEVRRAIIAFLLTLVFTAGVPFLPDFGLVLNITLKTIYFFTYIICLTLFGVVDQREWNGMLEMLRTIRRRHARGIA